MNIYWRLIIAITGCMALVISSCTTTSKHNGPLPAAAEASTPRVFTQAVPYSIASDAPLSDLVASALKYHPAIEVAEAKVRRSMAKVPQANRLPDPVFKVSTGSMAETAAGRVNWMAGVEQMLPFPAKLREMVKVADKEVEAAAAQLQSQHLNIAAQVRLAYWSYYLAKRTTEITSSNLEVLEIVRESVDARVATNRGDQSDQLRLASELGKLQKELIQSEQAQGSARSRLNALLNRPAGAALPKPLFRKETLRKDLHELIAVAEVDHPQIMAANAELDAFRHRLNRARLERFPDFMLGLQHASVSEDGLAPSANGRDQVIATIGVTIPLWQAPRRAQIQEAIAGIEEASAKIGEVRANLRQEIEDAWLRAGSADELITLFEAQILPESQQAFDSLLTSYAAGRQSLIDALDAWRQLLAFELQQAANETQMGMAIAALHKATGTSF